MLKDPLLSWPGSAKQKTTDMMQDSIKMLKTASNVDDVDRIHSTLNKHMYSVAKKIRKLV
eukprot:7629580-Karenia_brevis.AAC.1